MTRSLLEICSRPCGVTYDVFSPGKTKNFYVLFFYRDYGYNFQGVLKEEVLRILVLDLDDLTND